MNTVAVVIEGPERLTLSRLELAAVGDDDLLVDVEYSGISTGTERLLWLGCMPQFPGMGYPLVPGYESVGRVCSAGRNAQSRIGNWVFVPGARCFGEVRGLFGGAASRLVVPSARAMSIDSQLAEDGILLALAATAHHALAAADAAAPELIVGHGVLGRLLARLAIARGADPPVVWESRRERASHDNSGVGAHAYRVIRPEEDTRRDYRCIYDASGDATLLNALIAALGRGGQIVLAGFYQQPLSFSFPPAFMREMRLRVAAEWLPADLEAVKVLVASGALSLHGLITHRQPARDAAAAYAQAFNDPTCLKMVLDWRGCA